MNSRLVYPIAQGRREDHDASVENSALLLRIPTNNDRNEYERKGEFDRQGIRRKGFSISYELDAYSRREGHRWPATPSIVEPIWIGRRGPSC